MTDPTHTPGHDPESLTGAELLSTLRAEQDALENLLFRMETQHLLLVSGDHRWLARTTQEVSDAMAAVASTTPRREQAAKALHRAVGIAEDATLGAAADAVSDEMLSRNLYQRKEELTLCLDRIKVRSRQNRDLLAGALAATTDALAVLGVSPTYGSDGTVGATSGLRSRILDTRA